MTLNSFFCGIGGMDKGFHNEGFSTIYANEFSKNIAESFKANFPDTILDTRSISKIPLSDIPNSDGILGGFPCQSYSAAGAKRGIEDPRGKLFYDYLKIIEHIKPKFVVSENVKGLLSPRNSDTFSMMLKSIENIGYNVSYRLINCADYGIAQERERVIIVAYRNDLNKTFIFPEPMNERKNLRDVMGDLENLEFNVNNHEYIDDGYSPIFMSRQRVRGWNEPSFTILASSRFIPFHPSSPKMIKHGDNFEFAPGNYRRLTVRECARIQSFPDNYKIVYKNIRDGYKMIGNAVPPILAQIIARKIKEDFSR